MLRAFSRNIAYVTHVCQAAAARKLDDIPTLSRCLQQPVTAVCISGVWLRSCTIVHVFYLETGACQRFIEVDVRDTLLCFFMFASCCPFTHVTSSRAQKFHALSMIHMTHGR